MGRWGPHVMERLGTHVKSQFLGASQDLSPALGMTLNCIRKSYICCHHYVGH